MAVKCRKHVLQGQILTAAIWKPPLESEYRMPTLCPFLPFKLSEPASAANIYGAAPWCYGLVEVFLLDLIYGY
jgi:hypothetical protein